MFGVFFAIEQNYYTTLQQTHPTFLCLLFAKLSLYKFALSLKSKRSTKHRKLQTKLFAEFQSSGPFILASILMWRIHDIIIVNLWQNKWVFKKTLYVF